MGRKEDKQEKKDGGGSVNEESTSLEEDKNEMKEQEKMGMRRGKKRIEDERRKRGDVDGKKELRGRKEKDEWEKERN